MRIVLLPDDYLPSGTRIHAKMFHELAKEFIRLGHDVVVITPGSKNQPVRLIEDVYDNVTVWRYQTGPIRGVSKLKRAINERLMPFNGWRAISEKVYANPFDLCVNYSPSIFMGLLAQKLKATGTFVYLVLRDMFPQWVIDQGLLREKSLITAYFRRIEKLNYNTANCIGLMSQANLSLFAGLHQDLHHLEVLRNWSDTSPPLVKAVAVDWREKFDLDDKIIFFYGGNIGHAQDMTNLMRLAKSLQSEQQAHFLFVGQGDEFELIKDLQHEWGLSNVTIHPSISQSEFSELLTQVDIGLFSLSAKHSAHNFPGKLLGYMFAGIPILGSVNAGNDVLDTVNQYEAGLVFLNGDDEAFTAAARLLLSSDELRQTLGENARALLLLHFSVASAAKTIIAAKNSVC